MEISKQEDSPFEEMSIKIQTLDNMFPLIIKKSASVQDLKEKISESFNIPVSCQRLIFQGKLMQNSDKLKSYKIVEESVVHLVARSIEENSPTPQATSTQQNSENPNDQRVSVEDIFPLIEIPFRQIRRPRRRRLPHFDISECFESLYQNTITLQNLSNCKNKFDDNQIMQTRTIVPFNFTKSKYEVGQWVDVRDTIDQWLEAQVIQVRGNQAYVHYNGWGPRWDEWIDFSSSRIGNFKTYTVQSPTSVFLTPYPSIPCDSNIEQQHRNIDAYFYMEKSVGIMNELTKMIDHIGRLRKRTPYNRVNERDDIVVEKIEETKTMESNAQMTNLNQMPNRSMSNLNTNFLSLNDSEILFITSQLIPMMDRCGRMLSDLSLQLSHLILNPNLYPQLLLGYNQNLEVSDTLSCTSGYSMYTNEGSTISGFNNIQHLRTDQNIINNLQNPRTNMSIQNSNQMINNYNQHHNTQTSTTTTTTTNANQHTSTVQSQQTANNTYSGYLLSNSSSELPFIQRLAYSSGMPGHNIHSSHANGGSSSLDSFPKVNLQVPSMLSPGEVAMINGYNPYSEPNIDIYVHTVVTQQPRDQGSALISQEQSNIASQIPVQISGFPNHMEQQSSHVENSDLISNLTTANIERQTNVTSTGTNTNNISNNVFYPTSTGTSNPEGNPQNFNVLLESIFNMFGQSHNRRGSTASDTSNNSNAYPSQGINLNHNTINHNNGNTNQNATPSTHPLVPSIANNNLSNNPFLNINSRASNQGGSVSSRSHRSAGPLNRAASLNKTQEKETQTEMPLNLLSLNKENNYNENAMECTSNKSEKNFSLKNRNCKSYKSVSEISEFEENGEEEPSDFVIRTKKREQNMSNKLNESARSVESNYSKDPSEDKEEDERNNNEIKEIKK